MVKGGSTLGGADRLKSSEADLQAVSAITRNYASKLEQASIPIMQHNAILSFQYLMSLK